MKANQRQKTTLTIRLTPNEWVVLKAVALGFGDAAIRASLALTQREYQQYCNSLFTKLGVHNHYKAVQLAFEKKLLKKKDFCPEKVKARILEFAFEKWSEVPESVSKKELWALYDLLLEFYSHMDQTVLQLPEVEKNKKIPPKRDSRFSSTA
ncbi:MAG: hypothetical protein ACON4A_01180 [Flavobacteriaceae bacterium]